MASTGETHVTTRRPEPPPEADFAIHIQFAKGVGKPERVFQAADALIRALQRIDNSLCGSIDSHIDPMMVLEEIEVGSLKIYLRNLLEAADDQALKKLDWKPVVGKYLVRAKYAFIDWSNRADGEKSSLLDLAREIGSIAQETDVRHLPDYSPPSIPELAETAKQVDAAKEFLIEGDRMSYQSEGGDKIDFDLTNRWVPEKLIDMTIKERTEFDNMPMNLIVKKPDYLGSSKWALRHGGRTINASIEDEEWLSRFQARQADVRPGDALRCLVKIEYHYGYDNELVDEKYTITKVDDVLENQAHQLDLYDDN